MTGEEKPSPYQVPKSSTAVWLTPKGFSPGQCLRRFFVAGVLAAACGSVVLYAISNASASIIYQLLALGLPFSLALWLSMQRYIGATSTMKRILIVVGSLSAFAVCGAVYLTMLPRQNMVFEPLSWELMRAYVSGPAAGALVLTIVLWLTANRLAFKVLLSSWIILTIIGCVALLISDETGVRQRIVDETLAACVCGGVYVSVVLSIVGWQLAEANSTPVDPDIETTQPT